MSDEKKDESHPSYGMVQFTRTSIGGSGKHRMFGTAIKTHYTTIRLNIHRAVRQHDLSSDHFFAREQLIEVELSSAQFAELLTTMNVGMGVPCTIRWMPGEGYVEGPPDDMTEQERVETGFRQDMKDLSEDLRKYKAQIEKILKKPTITKADKEEINTAFMMVEQHVRCNIPFALTQFEKATEKVKTAAKAEVEQFTMHALVTTGLEAIRKGNTEIGQGEKPIGILPEKKDEKKKGHQ